jgi:hypothetical protein
MIALPVIDKDRRPNTTTIRDLDWYDCLVSLSGGKDSIALALGLLKKGVARERILLMHQHVDGEPGVDRPFMDWPCTATAGPSPRRWDCGCCSSGGTAASAGR